ncbi:MAG: transporter substrate-binding domain-containing protein [Solobacterium sp.]|nr:transporter substrate-binding domain-containing protein [Solobacterium sp.]
MRNPADRKKRVVPVLLAAGILLLFLFPFAAVRAETAAETVRVGWFESPYNRIDQFGRRSGYAYEYEQKISAYTGWNYEYVEGSWTELMEMLKAGKIDLMSDVSYKEERRKDMLYTSLPMGTESYYLFISKENQEIDPSDFSTLNGITVGVAKGSIQTDFFLQWEEMHEVKTELAELSGTDEESFQLLKEGTIDAYITMDIFSDPKRLTPVAKIGSSDFFFAVNRERPDLLVQLDAALSRIQDENRYYNQQLHELYLTNSVSERYLSTEEQEWLAEHGPIRVGYQDNYLAFCAADGQGKLTGALKEYLASAETCLENGTLRFEAIAYPSASEAMDALKRGEVDCMFPANLSSYESEQMSIVMTPALMRTEMNAVVRASEQKEFLIQKEVRVAVNEGNTNYEWFLIEHFPDWKIVYFPDTPSGLEGVAAGRADCVVISSYRFSNISKLCEKLHLSTVHTGVDVDYYFAVEKGNPILYSVLSRICNAVPPSITSAALTYYSTEDVRTSAADVIREYMLPIMTVISVIMFVIVVLLLRNVQAERKMLEEKNLVRTLNRKVFVDPLTSVRNKAAFDEAIEDLQRHLEEGSPKEFAAGVFDCDGLKEINDQYGHEKGDLYLKGASHLICTVFQHSPVFRIGGDEFAVILQNQDLQEREELIREFEERQTILSETAGRKWEEVHVAAGIAVYDPESDGSVSDTVRRADKLMYENKRMRKKEIR